MIKIDNMYINKDTTIKELSKYYVVHPVNNICTKLFTKKVVHVFGGTYYITIWYCQDKLTKIILYPKLEDRKEPKADLYFEALRYKYNIDNLFKTYGNPSYSDLYETRYYLDTYNIKTSMTNKGITNSNYFYRYGNIEINF